MAVASMVTASVTARGAIRNIGNGGIDGGQQPSTFYIPIMYLSLSGRKHKGMGFGKK